MPTGAAYCDLEKTYLAPSRKETLVENMSGFQLTKSVLYICAGPCLGTMVLEEHQ